MSVRITDIREVTKAIASPIRNAYIDFSKMTTSLVAVVTDAACDGRRVVGYGFNSNGRYGQGGLIRERFAPRLMDADPSSLQDAAGGNLDPDRVWAALMANEKPGGTASDPWPSAPSTWRSGMPWQKSPASRSSVCWRSDMGCRPIRACSSTPPAVITTPARTSAHCVPKCADISTAGTESSR